MDPSADFIPRAKLNFRENDEWRDGVCVGVDSDGDTAAVSGVCARDGMDTFSGGVVCATPCFFFVFLVALVVMGMEIVTGGLMV